LVARATDDLADLKQVYSDNAPQVIRAQEKLNSLKKQLADEVKKKSTVPGIQTQTINALYQDLQGKMVAARAKLQSLRNSVSTYDNSMNEYQGRIAMVPGIETKMFELQRMRLVQDEAYKRNMGWAQQLRQSSEGYAGQMVSQADAQQITEPVAPDSKKYLILAATVGALLGLAASFAIESFRLPVHTSAQLSDMTTVPVAAAVPSLSRPLQRRHMLGMRESSFKPAEGLRYMAFSMLAKENPPQVVMFSSVGEEVDSASAAAEFAIAVSKTGCKTILVDSDLRHPKVSEIFSVHGKSGVSDILARTILPGESVDLFNTTDHDHLTVLSAGSEQVGGLSDFVTSHLMALVADLRERSEMVVINCPPVDVFADASRLAQYVDETCMVISAKTTGYRAIPTAQEILEKSGAKSISIVLTNASANEEAFGLRPGERLRA
jgi:Mrp family chromosome partitioning ATPase